MSKNSLTISAKTATASNDAKDDEHFDIIDDRADPTEDKEDEFIVKMILKPTHNNGIEYIDRPQSSKLKKMLKKNKKDFKSKTDTVTLTQMVKRTKKEANNEVQEQNEEEMVNENDALNLLSSDTETDESEMDENDRIALEIDQRKEPEAKDTEPKATTKFHNTNIYLSAYEGGTKQRVSLTKLLNETKPKYIILYDGELNFVRQIEVYKAINYDLPLRVYFLMYSNSCEEQRYLTSIRSEKESFELLIKQKATMIVHEEQDGKLELPKDDSPQPTISSQMSSRQGGIVPQNQELSKVIVDMREFRSELPSMLHKRGFHIEPVTLEVGDYVLTPNICVERKSLNDLIESLANGRLYNQCSSMSRSYKTPVLLIEFDQKKPFLLNSNQALASNEISANHVSSKLVLLTLHFPKIRILWCSSPSETAEIFEELKSGCPQPDTELAVSIKTDQVKEDSETFVRYNSVLWDILLKIPGVNAKNIKGIMDKVSSLYDLCQKSEAELNELVENSKNAKLIFEFLNKTKKDIGIFEKEFDFNDVDDFNVSEKLATDNKQDSTNKPVATGAKPKKALVKIGSSNTNSKKKKTK